MKNKLTVIVLITLLFIQLSLSGCIYSENQTEPDEKDKDMIITEKNFVGNWSGFEMNNNLTIMIKLFTNNTGYFDNIPINWSIQNNTFKLGMFSGESPSYYSYQFNDNNTLILDNIHNSEIFSLQKDEN